ncbi:DUF4367 domain-containing protein [Paenibacillus dokdonensis]|uniref:DUF4367 domain-containing protein n=1 Tax=Paenibacillus dokdonensis TaxID=2567944 RepID=A0ABU6GHS6_9BACL|nr:DUF4367 domain-containing protein [Paenibacillus dokdonensis]MEC0239286.1 DUF4367 domain-containing protein [Paenibacillus dokdonensis]
MHELQLSVEDKSLRQMGGVPLAEDPVIRDFDVTDKVMDRVYKMGGWKQRFAARFHLRPRIAITSLILLVIMGASVTGYAASQYLEFRNSQGEVVLKTAKQQETTAFIKSYSELLGTYSQKVRDQLQQGEYAAYYIKDDVINKADIANPIKFEYKWVEYRSFGSLQNEIKRTKAPALNEPSHLPTGYHFDFGYVYPSYQYPMPSTNPDYLKLKDELIRQSNSAAKGEKVFMKKLSWQQADFTLARYVKGSDYMIVTVRNLQPDSRMTVFQNDQDTAEKVSMKGTDAYYIKSSDKTKQSTYASKNRLGWRDDQHNLYYEIYDNLGSKLTKQDFVQLAEDMIASH